MILLKLFTINILGNGNEEEPGSMLALLKVPVIDLILVTVIVSALLWVGLDPILEPNLRQVSFVSSVCLQNIDSS